MKKILVSTFLLLALVIGAFALVSCNNHQQTSISDGETTEDVVTSVIVETEIVTIIEEVTDEEGNAVTDDEGNVVTQEVTSIEEYTSIVEVLPEKVRYEVPAEGYDGSEVTITFSHTMGQSLRDVLDRYIVEFNKMYPNITIEHTQVGGYDDVRNQIRTELTAGNQPNMAYCYPDHVALYNITKKVVPLDNFIESKIEVTDALGNTTILGLTDEQIADFVPGFYKEGTAFDKAGTMYTLPMSKSTEVLYYNKTFFEANNLSVPTTWAEMEEVCKKILEIDPNCIPLGYDSESNWFITMTEQLGSPYTSTERGKNFLFNNDQNKAFVKMFREWYEAGYVTTQEIYGAYTSGLFTELSADVKNSYMSIGSSGGAQHQRPAATNDGYAFDVGITSIPQVDPSNPKVISQGPSICIFDSDNKQEVVATWLFVKFLTTTPEFQAAFSMTSGYMPVIKSVNNIPVYAEYIANANGGNNITALAVKVGNEQADAYYVSPAFNGSSAARDQVGKLMQYCFVNPTDNVDALLDEAFKAAIDECKAAQ